MSCTTPLSRDTGGQSFGVRKQCATTGADGLLTASHTIGLITDDEQQHEPVVRSEAAAPSTSMSEVAAAFASSRRRSIQFSAVRAWPLSRLAVASSSSTCASTAAAFHHALLIQCLSGSVAGCKARVSRSACSRPSSAAKTPISESHCRSCSVHVHSSSLKLPAGMPAAEPL